MSYARFDCSRFAGVMSMRLPEAAVMRFPRELHASTTSQKSHESHEE